MIQPQLKAYIEQEILPRYDHFDAAHQRNHADEVIARSLALAEHYEVNKDMVYAIAAYHDTGLSEGRDTHHLASSGHEPRSIYGKIVAEADRLITPEKVIRRTIQFGLDHYPELDMEGQYRRFRAHLMEKYSDTGYLRLWLPESENAPRLEELRFIIRDENKMREAFLRFLSGIWPND